MKVTEWLDIVAFIGESKIEEDDGMCYYSKFDDSYVARVGMENTVEHLAKIEITDQLSHGVGFSPKDGKWYGWSHRAIYGFKVGSICKKGDCHYFPANNQDAVADAIGFWKCADYHGMSATLLSSGNVQLNWKYGNKTPNHSLRQRLGGIEHYVTKGRGEWVAKTIEDAKQMAIDFNNGVS